MPFRFRETLTGQFLPPIFMLCFISSTAVCAQEPANESAIREQIAIAEKLLDKTPDRGAVLYFLAVDHAELGELHEAVTILRECIALKEGFDPQHEAAFAALKDSKEFQGLVEQAHKDFPRVTQATLAYSTTEKDLAPEGLAYDEKQQAFYLSSLHLHKIVRIPRQGKITDLVSADKYSLLPVLGIRVNPVDGSIWAASWLDNGKTELLHFNKNAALLGRYPPPDDRKRGLNDLVILRDGDVLITDTAGNQVLRFEANSQAFREIKFSRELLLPNGIALSGDGETVYVADQIGVLRLNLTSGETVEVDPGPKSTLAGADGLYWHEGKLIAVQNGIGTARIAVFALSTDGKHVTKTMVLENRSNFCVLPTTGALDGDDFYFIVNSQVNNLNGDKFLDVTKLEPVRIAKVKIP